MKTQHNLVMALVRSVLGAPEPSENDVDYQLVPDPDEESTTLELVQENEYELGEMLVEFEEFGDAARLADSSMAGFMEHLRELQSIWIDIAPEGDIEKAGQLIDNIITDLSEIQAFTQTIAALAGDAIAEDTGPVEHELPEEEPIIDEEEDEEVLDEEPVDEPEE